MKLKNVEAIRANKNEIYPLPICPCGTIVSSAPCDISLMTVQTKDFGGRLVPTGVVVYFCLECSLSNNMTVDGDYKQPYFNEDGTISEYEEVLSNPLWEIG